MSRAAIVLAGLLGLLLVALVADTGSVRRFEQRSLDTRFQIRSDRDADELAIVAIDDTTFSDLERQWPLPRSMHARVIDRLREAGVRQIVYDVQFTEPSERPDQDRALLEAVSRARGTVLATDEVDAFGRTNVLGGPRNLGPAGAVVAGGALPDEAGGTIRRYAAEVRGLDSLATAVARRLGDPVPAGRFDAGRALIDFAGPTGTVDSYSFSDVYNDRVPDADLRGRIVVVGATSPTLQDPRPTSMGSERLMPGPEIQANAIRTALDDNPLQETDGWVRGVLLAVLGAIAVVLVVAVGPVRGAAGAAVLGVIYAVVAQVAFGSDVVLPVAVPLLGLVATTVFAALTAIAQEMAERRRVAMRNVALEQAVRERTAELERTYLEPVDRLARAAELRDGDTGEHLDRMSKLCELVALELGQPAEDARLLRQAAVLHDVGKIGMPDGILRKPGKLTPEEIEIMRRHTLEGAALLEGSRSPLLQLAEVIARTHHERWDGTGYPEGLKGEQIPLPGRIAAVCDVYDALITERPYKRAWSPDEARQEIAEQRGRHFDLAVADALLIVLGEPSPRTVTQPSPSESPASPAHPSTSTA
jgi:CHASE2 domain-containing sensor protein